MLWLNYDLRENMVELLEKRTERNGNTVFLVFVCKKNC